MARTRSGKERFPFRIVIVPADTSPPVAPWLGTHKWKHRAIYNIRMKLHIQLKKASIRASQGWHKFYWVYGYGAPMKNEFICSHSGMVGKAILPDEVALFNDYWNTCAKKTKEVLNWLDSVPVERFSASLNSYLLRLVVVRYGEREMKEYEELNPYKVLAND